MLQPGNNLESIKTPKLSDIQIKYDEGVKWFHSWVKSKELLETGKLDKKTGSMTRAMFVKSKDEAQKKLEACLTLPGDCASQILKARACLLLAKLINQKDVWNRQRYFYTAVSIATRYHQEYQQNKPVGDGNFPGDRKPEEMITKKEIFETAIGYELLEYFINEKIDADLVNKFSKSHLPKFTRLFWANIVGESAREQKSHQERKQLARKNAIMDCKSTNNLGEITRTMEEIFGPLRISIHSDESKGSILSHNISEKEAKESIGGKSSRVKYITVEVFNRKKKYSLIIDRGSSEIENELTQSEFDDILPFIDVYINLAEQVAVQRHYDHNRFIDTIELNNRIPASSDRDYTLFLEKIIQSVPHPTVHEPRWGNEGYIDYLSQALAICKLISREELGLHNPNYDLYSEINKILGGTVKREVFQMVQSMFISRGERMNGLGYPFGQTRGFIPLEGKIYAIIRTYEALSQQMGRNEVIDTLQEWAKDGNFDPIILNIFLDCLKVKKFARRTRRPKKGLKELSAKRKERYESQVNNWLKIIRKTKEVEERYFKARVPTDDQVRVEVLYREISAARRELLELAGMRHLVIFTRHGETESDMVEGGAPGLEGETLNKHGIDSSKMKGEGFKAQKVKIDYIVTSPLERGLDSAIYIAETMVEDNTSNHEGETSSVDQVTRTSHEKVMSLLQSSPGVYERFVPRRYSRLKSTHVGGDGLGIKDNPLNAWGDTGESILGGEDIRKEMRYYSNYPIIFPEDSLGNQPKTKDNGRDGAYIQRLLADNPIALQEFLIDIISSTDESTYLIVSHRDTIRHAYLILINLHSREELFANKIEINNDTIITLFVEGGKVVPFNLLFSPNNWRETVAELNRMVIDNIGMNFYTFGDEHVNVIKLHAVFLDFLDSLTDKKPKIAKKLLKAMSENPRTEHFQKILEKEGFIDT